MYGYFADAEELALANTALGEGALASVNIAGSTARNTAVGFNALNQERQQRGDDEQLADLHAHVEAEKGPEEVRSLACSSSSSSVVATFMNLGINPSFSSWFVRFASALPIGPLRPARSDQFAVAIFEQLLR